MSLSGRGWHCRGCLPGKDGADLSGEGAGGFLSAAESILLGVESSITSHPGSVLTQQLFVELLLGVGFPLGSGGQQGPATVAHGDPALLLLTFQVSRVWVGETDH